MGYALLERSHYQTLGVPTDASLTVIKVIIRAQLPNDLSACPICPCYSIVPEHMCIPCLVPSLAYNALRAHPRLKAWLACT